LGRPTFTEHAGAEGKDPLPRYKNAVSPDYPSSVDKSVERMSELQRTKKKAKEKQKKLGRRKRLEGPQRGLLTGPKRTRVGGQSGNARILTTIIIREGGCR